MNVLTPTVFVGIILFVNHILSDILCCSFLIFRLLQHALQGWFAVQCSQATHARSPRLPSPSQGKARKAWHDMTICCMP